MRFVDVRTAETWCDYWILDSPTVSGSAQDSTSDYTLKAFWAVECPNLASMIPKLALDPMNSPCPMIAAGLPVARP